MFNTQRPKYVDSFSSNKKFTVSYNECKSNWVLLLCITKVLLSTSVVCFHVAVMWPVVHSPDEFLQEGESC